MKLEHIDLRNICRETDLVEVTVSFMDYDSRVETWITLGQASLRTNGRNGWELYARMDATDFEHDSAYVINLPLVGLQLDSVWYNQCNFIAWIDPESGEFGPNFRVPTSSDYDPRKLEDTYMCESDRCEKPHPVIPEKYYQPPFDRKLFEKVRGKKVEISFGPVRKSEE